MGNFARALAARMSRLTGPAFGTEGLVLTIDRTLIFHHGARRSELKLSRQEARELAAALLERANAPDHDPTAADPLGAIPENTPGYPVVMCTTAAIALQSCIATWDLSPAAVELPAVLPLQFNHDARAVIGIVRNIRREGDRIIGTAQFASHALAQAVRRDVDKGGFRAVSLTRLPIESQDLGPAVGHRVTRWRMTELTVCATGADPGATISPPAK